MWCWCQVYGYPGSIPSSLRAHCWGSCNGYNILCLLTRQAIFFFSPLRAFPLREYWNKFTNRKIWGPNPSPFRMEAGAFPFLTPHHSYRENSGCGRRWEVFCRKKGGTSLLSHSSLSMLMPKPFSRDLALLHLSPSLTHPPITWTVVPRTQSDPAPLSLPRVIIPKWETQAL